MDRWKKSVLTAERQNGTNTVYIHSSYVILGVSVRGGFMRVTCRECGSKSTIRKTNKISSDYTELYCGCNDPECGHTFVVSLGFSHSLSPSAKTSSQLAFELLNSLAPINNKN